MPLKDTVTVINRFLIIVLHSSEQYFSYIQEVNVFNDISIVYINEGCLKIYTVVVRGFTPGPVKPNTIKVLFLAYDAALKSKRTG
jgi:hypothetical protein